MHTFCCMCKYNCPLYLWAAVGSRRASSEVVLCQKEWRVGHVQDGVVDQHHFAEVKLVGEAFPFGFVQNALVVVVPVKQKEWGGGGRGGGADIEGGSGKDKGCRWRKKGRGRGKEEGRINAMLTSRFCFIAGRRE